MEMHEPAHARHTPQAPEQQQTGRTAAALTQASAPRSRGKHSGRTTTTPNTAITSRRSASRLSAPAKPLHRVSISLTKNIIPAKGSTDMGASGK